MRVFLTGATGFIGSAIAKELLGAGHEVVGLARSDANAKALEAAGVEILRGSLDDLDSLHRGAAAAEGVIHAGYKHDFILAKPEDVGRLYMEAAASDLAAVEAFGKALEGTNRPLVVTSGTAGLLHGKLGTEDDGPGRNAQTNARVKSEERTLSLAKSGVRASVMRLPPTVHGDGDHGFVHVMIKAAQAKGKSAYIGEGKNVWPAVHRLDAASAFRLALEKAAAGTYVHAVGEEGVPMKEIAEVIGRKLGVPTVSLTPEEASAHFGAIGHFVAVDNPTSSALTRSRLGWSPKGRGLILDLEQGTYFTNI